MPTKVYLIAALTDILDHEHRTNITNVMCLGVETSPRAMQACTFSLLNSETNTHRLIAGGLGTLLHTPDGDLAILLAQPTWATTQGRQEVCTCSRLQGNMQRCQECCSSYFATETTKGGLALNCHTAAGCGLSATRLRHKIWQHKAQKSISQYRQVAHLHAMHPSDLTPAERESDLSGRFMNGDPGMHEPGAMQHVGVTSGCIE